MEIEALHTAARRFCIEQFEAWVAKYSGFPAGGPYSADAYRIFPRYRLAQDTLVNIERIALSESASAAQLKDKLLKAGTSAFESLEDQLKNQPPALAALQDQLSAYSAYIGRLDANMALEVEPLPFRRVLSSEEVAALWLSPLAKWGIRGAGYGWFPLSDDPEPRGALTFHTDLWDSRQGAALFQNFLAHEGIARCYMLRELGPPDYELDRELATPAYDGSETFIFKDDGWLIYASHESSLTLVGLVADFFRKNWSDADSLGYRGPYHTDDLRGTWS
jgi:hypothetical protein